MIWTRRHQTCVAFLSILYTSKFCWTLQLQSQRTRTFHLHDKFEDRPSCGAEPSLWEKKKRSRRSKKFYKHGQQSSNTCLSVKSRDDYVSDFLTEFTNTEPLSSKHHQQHEHSDYQPEQKRTMRKLRSVSGRQNHKRKVEGPDVSRRILSLRQTEIQINELLQRNNVRDAYQICRAMLEDVSNDRSRKAESTTELTKWKMDEIKLANQITRNGLIACADAAFSTTIMNSKGLTKQRGNEQAMQRCRKTKNVGMDALNLLFHLQPYKAAPYSTVLRGFRASASVLDAATSFRLLQRLLTGNGTSNPDIRNSHQNCYILTEQDFNMALNVCVTTGEMELAHKVIGLQKRISTAPPLTAVTYSILIKGYGRLKNGVMIDEIIRRAVSNEIVPDIIMFNSIIDAYIRCDMMEQAKFVFQSMTSSSSSSFEQLYGETNAPRSTLRSTCQPDAQTYNTLLKGLALKGDAKKSLDLAQQMKDLDMWNDVSMNTLVNALVRAHEFQLAEDMLRDQANGMSVASNINGQSNRRNVEAYTELIDGYAKNGELGKALQVLQNMKNAGIEPNEITYTCVIGALAKEGKISQAQKLLQYAEASSEVDLSAVTYNAFITGLLDIPTEIIIQQESVYDARVDFALALLERMVSIDVRPDIGTVTMLIEAIGRSRQHGIDMAKAICLKFESDGTVPRGNECIGTAMVRACGMCNDAQGAQQAFAKIRRKDTIALNAFLDVCCKYGEMKLGFHTFTTLVRKMKGGLAIKSLEHISPDVVTFSVLICAIGRVDHAQSGSQMKKLYDEMRDTWGIAPDKVLVDIIICAMTSGGAMGQEDVDIALLRRVFHDARGLNWDSGELESRKTLVRDVVIGRVSEVWKDDSRLFKDNDELFEKKGWNKVDSGFRLWGGSHDKKQDTSRAHDKCLKFRGAVDEFLNSRGWNEVDSGFRII
mmetsp:Transcript_16042/g.19516  ORF Transcript_16042/g.19516 Transcript_16042/m.19516 type:complete len:934 (+) Transcript_16042:270-3071(+)